MNKKQINKNNENNFSCSSNYLENVERIVEALPSIVESPWDNDKLVQYSKKSWKLNH